MLSIVCASIAFVCLLLVVTALLGAILFTGLLLWATVKGHRLRTAQAATEEKDARGRSA